MYKYTMDVTKTIKTAEGNRREKVGEVVVPLFDLFDFGLYAVPAKVSEDGDMSYDDPKANFVLQAVIAALKANARNALQSGTATLKTGARIDSTIEEVLEASQGRSGEALKAYRDTLTAFVAWLAAKSGKKQGVQALYASMAKSKAAVEIASPRAKEGFVAVLEAFADSLTADEATRYAPALRSMADAATAEAEVLDDADF